MTQARSDDLDLPPAPETRLDFGGGPPLQIPDDFCTRFNGQGTADFANAVENQRFRDINREGEPLHVVSDGTLKLRASLTGATFDQRFEAAAEAHEPHRIAFYLYDLASAFHGLWNRGNEDPTMRFLRDDDPSVSRARLCLLRAVKVVIANGLNIFGITPVEEMR